MPSSRYQVVIGLSVAALCAACGSSSDGGSNGSGGGAGTGSGGSGASGGASGTAGAATGGAGGTGGSATGGTGGSATGGTGGSGTGGSGGSGGFTTIFTIVMENHDYNEIVGSANAPFVNSLIGQFGLATNYLDSMVHPSLPNYLYMISGAPQYGGLIDLGPTQSPFPVNGNNLGNQLTQNGVPWRSYQESMGTACNLANAGAYAPKHDPFLYFTDIQKAAGGLCAKTNVDYSQFGADLASGTYRYMWITPNLTNDGHDPASDPVGALKTSDNWLKAEIPKIMGSQAYQSGGVIFLTWDEAEGRGGNSKDQIPMIIISPKIVSAGFKSNKQYSHASYLATIEDLFGFPRLGAAAQAQTMMEFFKP